MMRSLRSRFIFSHLLPILIVVPLISLSLIYLLETQVILADLSEHVSQKATLIAESLDTRPEVLTDPEQGELFLADLTVYFDEQVLLIDPQGNLLAGSPDQQPVTIDDLETAVSEQPNAQINYGLLRQRVIVIVPVTDINQQLLGSVGVVETLSGAATVFGQLRWLLAIILIVELVLGCVVGYLLAVRLERPINQVATAVINISRGETIEPLPAKGAAEIREMNTAVNTLAERLRLLEETRRRLLANLVHEIGRPLGAMRSAVHVLRQGAGDDPEIREELLAGVENEIERMQPLLNDLAQLYGQVLGTIELKRQPTAVSDWLPPLLLPWCAAAQDKGLEWQSEIATDLPTLNIDPDRLAQVVGNLCSNAVKYTPEGGRVQVTAASAALSTGVAGATEVCITISDSGPGIIAEEQEAVFEPFFRSQQQRRFPQGLGLGLTIARDLVEAHGGRLTVNSSAENGTHFTIHLPADSSN